MKVLGSNIFGLSTAFTKVSTELFSSETGNLYLLGTGHIGGKGDGLIFLDRAQKEVGGYDTARALILSHDWFGIAEQPLENPAKLSSFNEGKVATLFDTIEGLKLSGRLAIRASAQVEDIKGNPAAGHFRTEFHGRPLDSIESKSAFIAKLQAVYNSAYSELAKRHWRQQGYSAIPPIPVIIQDVVGSVSEANPNYFFPIVAGISNGALHTKVRVRTVLGLGGSAVDLEGLGKLHSLPILEGGQSVYDNQNRSTGKYNDSDIRALDLCSGAAIRQRGADAKVLSAQILNKVRWNMPGIPMTVAELNLAFERMLGCPVDLEWACADLEKLSLLQCREVQKRCAVKKPQLSTADIIVESSNVNGFGSEVFDTVIVISGIPDQSMIAQFTQSHPNSLVVYETRVKYPNTFERIEERIFPYANTLVLSDSESDHVASVLSHFVLNCEEMGKVLVHTPHDIVNEIGKRGSIVESHMMDSWMDCSINVYKLDRRIGVAADSEFEWGMVYWAPESAERKTT